MLYATRTMIDPAAPPCPAQPALTETRAERHARWLARMGELGMQELERVMTAPQIVDDDGKVDLARERERVELYERLTRSLRRTAALETRLEAIAAKAASDACARRAESEARAAE